MTRTKTEKKATDVVLPKIVRLSKSSKTLLNMAKARGTYTPAIKAALVDSAAWRAVTGRLILGGKRADASGAEL